MAFLKKIKKIIPKIGTSTLLKVVLDKKSTLKALSLLAAALSEISLKTIQKPLRFYL